MQIYFVKKTEYDQHAKNLINVTKKVLKIYTIFGNQNTFKQHVNRIWNLKIRSVL